MPNRCTAWTLAGIPAASTAAAHTQAVHFTLAEQFFQMVAHSPPNGQVQLRLRRTQPAIARALTGAAVSWNPLLDGTGCGKP